MTFIPLLILFIIGFYLGLTYYLNDCKVPESLSATSYLHKDNHVFTLFCTLVAGLLAPVWLSVTSDDLQFLVFLSCMGMLMAGVTPLFQSKGIQKTLHYTGGLLAFIAFILWSVLTHNWILLSFSLGLGGIGSIKDRKNFVFYLEISSLVSTTVYIFITLLKQ